MRHELKCPVCGKTDFIRQPATFLGESVDPGSPRLAVVPFICRQCRAVTLAQSPDQPELDRDSGD